MPQKDKKPVFATFILHALSSWVCFAPAFFCEQYITVQSNSEHAWTGVPLLTHSPCHQHNVIHDPPQVSTHALLYRCDSAGTGMLCKGQIIPLADLVLVFPSIIQQNHKDIQEQLGQLL